MGRRAIDRSRAAIDDGQSDASIGATAPSHCIERTREVRNQWRTDGIIARQAIPVQHSLPQPCPV